MKTLINELPAEFRYALISLGCVLIVGLLMTGAFMAVGGSTNQAATAAQFK